MPPFIPSGVEGRAARRPSTALGHEFVRALLIPLGLVVLLSPGLATAEEQRYDHRGSLGLTAAAGGEFVTTITLMGGGERGFRVPLEIGATLSITNHIELRASGRIAPGISPITALAGSAFAGMRNSFGYEQWKTFFDLELALHFTPFLAIGARAAFGVQYDFLPIMGVYAQLGGQLGGATSLRLSFELMAGVQFRTYLFE